MVDIAASLSLTPSSKAFDPAGAAGMEAADIQAFGDILAEHIIVRADSSSPAAPLPLPSLPISTFSISAGNRQADGKILPAAAAVLPDAQVTDPENASQPILPEAVVTPVETAVARVLTVRVPLKAIENSKAFEPAPVAAAEEQTLPPAHAPIKVAAQVVRAIKGAASGQSEADQREPVQTDVDGDVEQQVAVDPAAIRTELPGMPFFAGALQPASSQPIPAGTVADRPAAKVPGAPAMLVAAKTDVDNGDRLKSQPATPAVPATRSASLAPGSSAMPSTRPAEPVSGNQAQSQPAEAAAKSSVLTVVAAAQTQVATVALGNAEIRPAGQAVTARIKIAAPEGAAGRAVPAAPVSPVTPELVASRAMETTVSAAPVARMAAVDRAPTAERTVADLSVPMVADIRAPAASAPAPAVTLAPVVEMPRHDFAALVDRLIEARNASTPHSVGASINHAEFGQVSLQFHQDGKDLSVSMSSADPEFTAAVQAAMPADRPASTGDGQQRGQGHTPAHSQAQSQAASSHQEATGQRGAETGQQARDGQQPQGRNSRGGVNTSNSSGSWSDRDQPQSRGGIFA